jgi:tRNA nucleotidyltransferase (CCA-adding enzyme)
MSFSENADMADKFREALSPRTGSLVREIALIGKELGVGIFLVGGTVRDILIGRRSYDLDVLVEKKAIELGRILAMVYDLSLKEYPKFGTCTLVFPSDETVKGIKVDIASAREETYAAPGTLPRVRPSTVERDLRRRDFTVNSLAMEVGKEDFGVIRDVCGGLRDLNEKLIRVLHDESFLDDPSRIFRAVRFSERLSFNIEEHTGKLIDQAVKSGMMRRVRESRIKEEWSLLEAEGEEVFIRAVKKLEDILKEEMCFVRDAVKSGKEGK